MVITQSIRWLFMIHKSVRAKNLLQKNDLPGELSYLQSNRCFISSASMLRAIDKSVLFSSFSSSLSSSSFSSSDSWLLSCLLESLSFNSVVFCFSTALSSSSSSSVKSSSSLSISSLLKQKSKLNIYLLHSITKKSINS